MDASDSIKAIETRLH